MKITALQFNIIWEDPQANFDKISNLLMKEEMNEVDILVLPEMFNTGFSMNVMSIAEPMNGKSINFLIEMASRHQMLIITTCKQVKIITEFEVVNQAGCK